MVTKTLLENQAEILGNLTGLPLSIRYENGCSFLVRGNGKSIKSLTPGLSRGELIECIALAINIACELKEVHHE